MHICHSRRRATSTLEPTAARASLNRLKPSRGWAISLQSAAAFQGPRFGANLVFNKSTTVLFGLCICMISARARLYNHRRVAIAPMCVARARARLVAGAYDSWAGLCATLSHENSANMLCARRLRALRLRPAAEAEATSVAPSSPPCSDRAARGNESWTQVALVCRRRRRHHNGLGPRTRFRPAPSALRGRTLVVSRGHVRQDP